MAMFVVVQFSYCGWCYNHCIVHQTVNNREWKNKDCDENKNKISDEKNVSYFRKFNRIEKGKRK